MSFHPLTQLLGRPAAWLHHVLAHVKNKEVRERGQASRPATGGKRQWGLPIGEKEGGKGEGTEQEEDMRCNALKEESGLSIHTGWIPEVYEEKG